jgi:hypothetical protein
MGSILSSISCNLKIQAAIASSLPTVSGNTFIADQNNVSMTFGSAVGQSDGSYTTVGNVSAGTPVVINVASLVDVMGASLTVAHVTALIITNTNTNLSTGTLTPGGGSNPVFAALPSQLAITPTDSWAQTFNGAGLPVTGGSAQNLQLAASAGIVGYRVTALTRSA